MGQYERDMVKPILTAQMQQEQIKSGAMMLGAAGATFAAFTFYKWAKAVTGWTTSIVEDVKDWKNDLLLVGDKDNENNNVDPLSLDSYGYPFQVLFGGGGQADNGNDVNILGLPGWGIIPGVL